jgi:hypothetical protein
MRLIIYNRCPKITILGEAAGPDRQDQFLFEEPVRRALDNLVGMQVGQVVLDEIKNTPHQVTIIPFRDTKPTNASSSAAAAVVDTGEKAVDALAARTRQGQPVMVPDQSKPGVCRDKAFRVNGKVLIGTGRGTEEIVEYTPRHWVGYGDRLTPETVLVHELTHALRAKMGIMQKKSFCNAYDDQEEFFAILVENIFRSECKKKGQNLILRWHHKGHSELPPKLANPAFFFQFHKQRIWQMQREMPHFATTLMDMRDLAFNPFAAKNQVA